MLISFKPIAGKNLEDAMAIPKHYTLVVHKNVKQVIPSKEVTSVFIERIKIGYHSSIELSM